MSQVFQVLRCYKCLVFQVYQTKKDNKWVCKMCGEKQSVKRHYGIGTGKDCRLHVQKLNKMRGEKELAVAVVVDSDDSDYNADDFGVCKIKPINIKDSKWSLYVDEQEKQQDREEDFNLNEREIKPELSQKRKQNDIFKHSKKFKNMLDNDESNLYQFKNETETTGCTVNSSPDNIPVRKIAICNNSKLENIITQNIHKKVSLQSETHNKDSKWAKFIDTNDDIDESNDDKKYSNRQPLFSLCDDSEIDAILDL